jgi:phosphoribosylamine---glycine ligase
VITGLPQGGDEDDHHVFHAGTTLADGKVVTAGGRVLCVTALGDTVRVAQRRAYEVADRIQFDGCQMRRDIGFRAIGARRSLL